MSEQVMVMDRRHWETRAANVRVIADNIRDWRTKMLLYDIAKKYLELADHTETLSNKVGFVEVGLVSSDINAKRKRPS